MSEHYPSPEQDQIAGEHSFDLAQRLSGLPPFVEQRKNTLVEEILVLCRKHGCSHPKELDLAPRISLGDLKMIRTLLEKLDYIFIHRKLPKGEQEPLDDQEYTIELPPNADVVHVLDDHGRPIVVGYRRFEDYFLRDALGYERQIGPEVVGVALAFIQGQPVVVEEVEENGLMRRHIRHITGEPFPGLTESYSSVSTDRKGEIDHVMTKDLMVCAVGEKGRLGRVEGYAFTGKAVSVGGRSYFLAREEKDSEIQLYDEDGEIVEIQTPYDDLLSLMEMNGSLVLTVRRGNRYFFVDTKGDLLEGEDEEGFEDVSMRRILGKAIYFIDAHKDTNEFHCHTDGEAIFSIPRKIVVSDFTKIGDRFFFLTSGSFQHDLYCFPPLEAFSRDLKRVELFVKDVSVLPIGVGSHMIFEKQGQIFVDNSAGRLPRSFEKVYAMEPIDEHRWYVIGKKDTKVMKSVFDLRLLSFV
jgi:hypothetical protein